MKIPNLPTLAALVACTWAVMRVASAQQANPAVQTGPSEDSAGQLQEVVVTAQRRQESAQRAAIAISTVLGDSLRLANVSTAGGLTKLVPSIQTADTSGPYPFFYIRGVGSFTGNALSDSAVAFNFNNVYIGRPTATNGFLYDLERVEILKGPQGTLYGRNATGGAINVISRKPVLGALTADLSAEFGNFSRFRADGAFNAPLGDVAAVRAAFFHVKHNGYLSDGTDDEDETGGRLSFRVRPADGLDVVLVSDYFKQKGKGNGVTVAGITGPVPPVNFGIDDRVGISSAAGSAFLGSTPDVLLGRNFAPLPDNTYQNNNSWGVSSTIDWSLPFGTLTVIPAYRGSDIDYRSYVPGFEIREQGRDRQTSFEARLASDDKRALSYLLGVFYYDETDHVPNFDVNSQAQISLQSYDTDTVSRAVFGRLTYAVVDSLRIVGGVRYTRENKDFAGRLASNNRICVFGFLACPAAIPYPYGVYSPVPPAFIPGPTGTIDTLTVLDDSGANERGATYSRTTWHGGLDWDVTDHNLLYASAETGFKAGGFFFSSDYGYYKPEAIRAFTLGSKNRFLDNRLQLNLELYYWKYTDQQISHLGEDSRGTIIFPTENVGSATFKGAELDLKARPLVNTLASLDVQYNDAIYDSFVYHTPNTNGGVGNGTGCPNLGVPTGTYTVNCSGRRPPFAPLWSATGSLQQTLPLPDGSTLVGTASVHFQSDTLTALDFLPPEYQAAFATTDITLTYSRPGDRYYITGFVDNAFDRTVKAYTDPVPFGLFVVGSLRPPRTYGVRIGAHFR